MVETVVGSARREGDVPVIVTVATIQANKGNTSRDLFGAVLDGVALTGDVSRALGGQGFLISGSDFEVVIAPVAVQPALLLLVVIGEPNAPVEELAMKMLRTLSRAIPG